MGRRMTDARATIADARRFVAVFFQGLRRTDLAEIVLAGGGDDFPEVQAAVALIEDDRARHAERERALRLYAGADFWDDTLPGGSLAWHDRGEMARNVLSGRDAFYHGD